MLISIYRLKINTELSWWTKAKKIIKINLRSSLAIFCCPIDDNGYDDQIVDDDQSDDDHDDTK